MYIHGHLLFQVILYRSLGKDASSENEFDDKSSIEYTINLEYIKEPIKIEKVILDKGKHV